MRQGNWRPSITNRRPVPLALDDAMITWALIASAVIALVLVVLVQGKWTSRDSWVRGRLCLSHHGYGDRPLRQSHQLAGEMFRRSSAAVATNRADHRSPGSGLVELVITPPICSPISSTIRSIQVRTIPSIRVRIISAIGIRLIIAAISAV